MKPDDFTLFFPKDIARRVGMARNDLSLLKNQGCPFYGRKTCVAWVRAFLAQRAGAVLVMQAAGFLPVPSVYPSGSAANKSDARSAKND